MSSDQADSTSEKNVGRFNGTSPALSYADSSTLRPASPHVTSGISRGDIAALAVRILGLYVGLQSLEFLEAAMRWGGIARGFVLYWPYFAVAVVFAGITCWLILGANMIAGWLLPSRPAGTEADPAPGSPMQLQAAAFAVVGVVLAVEAIPLIVYALWVNHQIATSVATSPVPRATINPLRAVIRLVLGVFLFVGSKRLSRLWLRLRWAPRAVSDESGPL